MKSFCHFPLNHVSIDVNIPKDALFVGKRATRKETEPRRSKFDSILLGGERGKSRPGWMAAVVLEAGSEKPPLREETGGALQHRCPSLLLYNILACLESREVQATQP